MKWMASHSGELNNCATYFSSFANVSQATTTKHWWHYWRLWSNMHMATVGIQKRLEIAREVEAFKQLLRDPTGKQGEVVTKFISQNV